MNKDFENFELKLVKLREESWEIFEDAERNFDEQYKAKLEHIFPRDILWAKKYISWLFSIAYVNDVQTWNDVNIWDIFKDSVEKTVSSLPLSSSDKKTLSENILWVSRKEVLIWASRELSQDPLFPLIEDLASEEHISKEEFLLFEKEYKKHSNFIKSLEVLPSSVRNIFHKHLEYILSDNHQEKQEEFHSEYHQELQTLEHKGYNIEAVMVFVSRSYYKSPGKLRKYEHPKRRMRRTFKIALLKLLRTKLWNVQASILLERFESGEYFEDFFLLIFELLEIINENPDGEEVFSTLKLDDDTESLVHKAEVTKEKILNGEKITANISSLIGETDSHMEWWVLEKILDEDTDLVGDELHFAREDDKAGIYAQNTENPEQEEEEDEYENMSPEIAYELLKKQFQDVEQEKRSAFLEGRYDDIDVYNDSLITLESKLEKLTKLLGVEL